MNKIYDKLLLLLAGLALLGGAALFVLKSGADEFGSSGPSQPAENPYVAVPVPESGSVEAEWPEPLPQSSGPDWLYDVFTPPKIYIDKDGLFTAEPPKLPTPPEPFGIFLVDVARKLYRIQFEGYIEEDLSDASKSLILLYDEERKIQIRVRPGEAIAEAELTVLDFMIERKFDPAESTVLKTVKLELMDERAGEQVTFIHGERLFDSTVTVVVASEENPEERIELTEEGASFELASAQYVLQKINLEENSATFEKQAMGDGEAEVRVLSPQFIPQENEPDESDAEVLPSIEVLDLNF
ncbi:MAG: hypothetical protein AAF065_09215 [Verrucomicrobiota bacterium]